MIGLQNFLKMYTSISEKFIDEFYYFYELCEKDEFGINVEEIITYLGIVKKENFYRRIRDGFNLGTEYIIKKNLTRDDQSSKRLEYFVTFRCFQKICASSRTEKGSLTLEYFSILWDLIEFYQDTFANAINNGASLNKVIYLIVVNKNKNIFKVGRTENLRNRLRAYATGKEKHPDIAYIILVHDPAAIEGCVKNIAGNYLYKDKKEIYKIDKTVLKSAIYNCAFSYKKVREAMKNYDKYDSYVVYDDSKNVEYVDINGNFVAFEKGTNIVKYPHAIKKSPKIIKKSPKIVKKSLKIIKKSPKKVKKSSKTIKKSPKNVKKSLK